MAEFRERVFYVYQLLLHGVNSTRQIERDPTVATWAVGSRQVFKYIKSARALISSDADHIRAEELALALGRINDIYRQSYLKQDYKGCLNAQKEINQLLGLYFQDELLQRIEYLETALK